jgi:hypothetical protein
MSKDTTTGTVPEPDDTVVPTDTAASETLATAEPTTTPAPAKRSGAPKALAVTGIAVGAVLVLGLTFAAGVGAGRFLPDRGPDGTSAEGGQAPDRPTDEIRDGIREGMGERMDERMGERMDEHAAGFDERMDERHDQLEQLFQEWLDERESAESTN